MRFISVVILAFVCTAFAGEAEAYKLKQADGTTVDFDCLARLDNSEEGEWYCAPRARFTYLKSNPDGGASVGLDCAASILETDYRLFLFGDGAFKGCRVKSGFQWRLKLVAPHPRSDIDIDCLPGEARFYRNGRLESCRSRGGRWAVKRSDGSIELAACGPGEINFRDDGNPLPCAKYQ